MILRPPKAPTVWAPHPGSQVQFLTCPIFECLLEGTRGGGKTDALLMSFAQFVGVGFGQAWRGALFRETYPQLADVAQKSKRWFRQFFPGAKFNESTYTWKFPDGEELLLRQGVKEDDYWDFHGHELPWLGFEELTNWRSLAFYEMMHSCCRSSHPGMPRMVRATTNPYGRGHAAVKERFQLGSGGAKPGQIITDQSGRDRTHVHSDIAENTTLMRHDPEYIKSLDGIKDQNRKKAWRYGSWDINVGAFLADAWDPLRHVCKPFPIPANWNIWMAMDWGYAKPYAIGWFAKDPEGKTYMWRELYGIATDDDGKFMPDTGTKETPDKVAQRIVAREAHDGRVGYDISLRITGPDSFARGGSQYGTQITHAQTFRRHGLKFRPWWAGPGSRKAGALLVKQMLEEDQLVIFRSCQHTIRTVPTLNPDPDDPDDVATDEEDHCFAADTLVLTQRGNVPICDVMAGDMVLNHEGRWVATLGARLTRRDARVIRMTLANGRDIVCTPDHRFFMAGNTFWRARDLLDINCYGLLEEYTCKSTSSATPFKNSTAFGTTDAGHISSAKASGCIGQFGSVSTDAKCQTASRFTMPTRTGPTTSPGTLTFWRHRFIEGFMAKARAFLSTFKSLDERPQRHGTPAMKVDPGTKTTLRKMCASLCTNESCTHADVAASSSKARSTLSIAASPAGASIAERLAPIKSPSPASIAGVISIHADRTTSGFVAAPALQSTGALRVLQIKRAGAVDVWCLSVPDGETFTLAAGPVVHNCFDMLKAALMRRTSNPPGEDESLSGDYNAGGAHIQPDGSHRIDRIQR